MPHSDNQQGRPSRVIRERVARVSVAVIPDELEQLQQLEDIKRLYKEAQARRSIGVESITNALSINPDLRKCFQDHGDFYNISDIAQLNGQIKSPTKITGSQPTESRYISPSVTSYNNPNINNLHDNNYLIQNTANILNNESDNSSEFDHISSPEMVQYNQPVKSDCCKRISVETGFETLNKYSPQNTTYTVRNVLENIVNQPRITTNSIRDMKNGQYISDNTYIVQENNHSNDLHKPTNLYTPEPRISSINSQSTFTNPQRVSVHDICRLSTKSQSRAHQVKEVNRLEIGPYRSADSAYKTAQSNSIYTGPVSHQGLEIQETLETDIQKCQEKQSFEKSKDSINLQRLCFERNQQSINNIPITIVLDTNELEYSDIDSDSPRVSRILEKYDFSLDTLSQNLEINRCKSPYILKGSNIKLQTSDIFVFASGNNSTPNTVKLQSSNIPSKASQTKNSFEEIRIKAYQQPDIKQTQNEKQLISSIPSSSSKNITLTRSATNPLISNQGLGSANIQSYKLSSSQTKENIVRYPTSTIPNTRYPNKIVSNDGNKTQVSSTINYSNLDRAESNKRDYKPVSSISYYTSNYTKNGEQISNEHIRRHASRGPEINSKQIHSSSRNKYEGREITRIRSTSRVVTSTLRENSTKPMDSSSTTGSYFKIEPKSKMGSNTSSNNPKDSFDGIVVHTGDSYTGFVEKNQPGVTLKQYKVLSSSNGQISTRDILTSSASYSNYKPQKEYVNSRGQKVESEDLHSQHISNLHQNDMHSNNTQFISQNYNSIIRPHGDDKDILSPLRGNPNGYLSVRETTQNNYISLPKSVDTQNRVNHVTPGSSQYKPSTYRYIKGEPSSSTYHIQKRDVSERNPIQSEVSAKVYRSHSHANVQLRNTLSTQVRLTTVNKCELRAQAAAARRSSKLVEASKDRNKDILPTKTIRREISVTQKDGALRSQPNYHSSTHSPDLLDARNYNMVMSSTDGQEKFPGPVAIPDDCGTQTPIRTVSLHSIGSASRASTIARQLGSGDEDEIRRNFIEAIQRSEYQEKKESSYAPPISSISNYSYKADVHSVSKENKTQDNIKQSRAESHPSQYTVQKEDEKPTKRISLKKKTISIKRQSLKKQLDTRDVVYKSISPESQGTEKNGKSRRKSKSSKLNESSDITTIQTNSQTLSNTKNTYNSNIQSNENHEPESISNQPVNLSPVPWVIFDAPVPQGVIQTAKEIFGNTLDESKLVLGELLESANPLVIKSDIALNGPDSVLAQAGPIEQALLTVCGADDSIETIWRKLNASGGCNAGMWLLTCFAIYKGKYVAEEIIVKLTNSTSSGLLEAETMQEVAAAHPSILEDRACSFPILVMQFVDQQQIFFLRRARGEDLSRVLAIAALSGGSNILPIFRRIGEGLADMHVNYDEKQHTDFQTGNIYYCQASDVVTFIDLGGLGTIAGDTDLAHLCECLQIIWPALRLPLQLSQAQEAFQNGYAARRQELGTNKPGPRRDAQHPDEPRKVPAKKSFVNITNNPSQVNENFTTCDNLVRHEQSCYEPRIVTKNSYYSQDVNSGSYNTSSQRNSSPYPQKPNPITTSDVYTSLSRYVNAEGNEISSRYVSLVDQIPNTSGNSLRSSNYSIGGTNNTQISSMLSRTTSPNVIYVNNNRISAPKQSHNEYTPNRNSSTLNATGTRTTYIISPTRDSHVDRIPQSSNKTDQFNIH